MKRIWAGFLPLTVAVSMLLAYPGPASAYVGPGAGLTVIGAAIAFVGSVVLAIFGFVWYPVKRFLRSRRDQSVPTE